MNYAHVIFKVYAPPLGQLPKVPTCVNSFLSKLDEHCRKCQLPADELDLLWKSVEKMLDFYESTPPSMLPLRLSRRPRVQQRARFKLHNLERKRKSAEQKIAVAEAAMDIIRAVRSNRPLLKAELARRVAKKLNLKVETVRPYLRGVPSIRR
jgi:hypothetical protein